MYLSSSKCRLEVCVDYKISLGFESFKRLLTVVSVIRTIRLTINLVCLSSGHGLREEAHKLGW
jgi:hypothetical protein